jgi:hypothetical protein
MVTVVIRRLQNYGSMSVIAIYRQSENGDTILVPTSNGRFSLTNRTVLLIGALFGLAISGAVLTLLWFGVAGVLHPNATGTDWMHVFWPASVMLVVGWRSTIPGLMITVSAVGINCVLYMAIAYAIWQLARLLRRLWV